MNNQQELEDTPTIKGIEYQLGDIDATLDNIKDAINTYTLTNDYYASLFEPIDSKQNLV